MSDTDELCVIGIGRTRSNIVEFLDFLLDRFDIAQEGFCVIGSCLRKNFLQDIFFVDPAESEVLSEFRGLDICLFV